MTELDWAALWKRDAGLRPEALGAPGELQFDAVRCDGPWYVGIPWAKAMLTKDPEFTTRHNNDIDIAQSQLDDAKEVLDRAHAALCCDAAAKRLASLGDRYEFRIRKEPGGEWHASIWVLMYGGEEDMCVYDGDSQTYDEALYAAMEFVQKCEWLK